MVIIHSNKRRIIDKLRDRYGPGWEWRPGNCCWVSLYSDKIIRVGFELVSGYDDRYRKVYRDENGEEVMFTRILSYPTFIDSQVTDFTPA